jgi:hypothetical protein
MEKNTYGVSPSENTNLLKSRADSEWVIWECIIGHDCEPEWI